MAKAKTTLTPYWTNLTRRIREEMISISVFEWEWKWCRSSQHSINPQISVHRKSILPVYAFGPFQSAQINTQNNDIGKTFSAVAAAAAATMEMMHKNTSGFQ